MHKPTILSFCLLLLSAVIALKLGFFTFDGAQAVGVVKYTGYWGDAYERDLACA
jgi:hypothetical protein